MFGRWLSRINGDQKGITGLETAIILIAFVMVASVLAYVVLTAGLYSSQKAKEAVHAGLDEVQSCLEVRGSVLLSMVGGYGQYLYLTLGVTSGSGGVDFADTSGGNNKVVISYTDQYNMYPTLDWTTTVLSSTDNDTMLDPNELFLITVDLTGISDNASADSEKIGAYHEFAVELKPPNGATLIIERTVPARVSQIVNLH
ncbi:archaellin/type IV pilin N-terminal domain-containing protein [Chloroflexota bacterium]